MRKTILVLALSLFAAVSLYAQVATPVITSLSPDSIAVSSGEHFLHIEGSGFYGDGVSLVTYTSAEGTETLEPGAFSSTSLDVWVPVWVVQTPGTYQVTVTNDNGVDPAVTSNAATFTVTEGPGPTITVPDSVSAEATSASGAVVTYEASATSATDPDVNFACYPASGSLFAIGVTVVDCVAEDNEGRTASDSFEVTVADTTAPTVSLTASPNVLTPPNGHIAAVTVTANATDAVDASPTSQIVSVTADEPTAAGDITITGPMTVDLRAKKNGASRTYTIVVETTDDAGNVTTSSVDVKVGKK